MNPPPLKVTKPKRFAVYVAFMFILSALYIIGIVNSSGSESTIIRDLTPIRVIAFVISSVCFGAAGILFLKKNRLGRLFVILGILVHFAYMLHFNIKVLYEYGPPGSLAIGGMVFGLVTIFAIFSVIGAIPFTRKFSDQLRRNEES